MDDIAKRLVEIVPSERQLRHQQLEFYGFFHFSINTFTDKEWGDGSEAPGIFCPEKPDALQWVRAIKAAGMKGAILTCKHHDGFCLWPSRYTAHSVASSPYKGGNGDLVKEVSAACREEGMAFGIYLSPWDRNHPSYGSGKEYDDYFVNQLTELLTGYGEIFCVWLDGACGEGKNGRVQSYDWERYYQVIRTLRPDACISVCGPDIRWCGNEAGEARPQEWSVVPSGLKDAERTKERSQQTDDEAFRKKQIRSDDMDLGSREALAGERELIWYPAEVDVSIRPGWFYHPSEDGRVRSLKELVHIYDSSLGQNATLLLNIPPTREGLIHENDVRRLKELGDYIKGRVSRDFAREASVSVSEYEIVYTWKEPAAVSCVILKEDIRFSQRIERFSIWDQAGKLLYHGNTVGYQKIAVFETIAVDGIIVRIEASRMEPKLEFVGIY